MNTLLTAPIPSVALSGTKPVVGNAAMARRQAKDHPRARILYVEDEEVIRDVAEIILARAGYSVTTAADGEDGWAALNSVPFDVVVTDHNMPRLTGMELATRARMYGLTIPFIIASGSAGCFSGSEIKWLRLAAILEKPFSPDELVSTVRQVLLAAASARQESSDFSPA